MAKILKSMKLIFASYTLALLSTIPTSSYASLVLDDFDSSPSSQTSLVDQGSVTRQIAGGASMISGGIQFAPTNLSAVFYTVADSMKTFGDLNSEFTNGVSFSSSNATAGSDFELAFYADGVQQGSAVAISSGPMSFDFDLTNVRQLGFLVLGCTSGDHAAQIGVTLSAVPEPTSLLLFGMASSVALIRRRRL